MIASVKRVVFLLLILSGLLLVACQPQAQPAATPVVVTQEVTRVVTEQIPADPGRLVIYSGRSETLVAPIIQQFAEATGIQVEVRYGSTSEMAATLMEEGANSPADIFYAQDPGALGAIADAGLLAPLPEATLAKVPARFKSDAGDWVGISGRARVVVYNTDLVNPEELPDDLWGFTEPKWNGRIGWAPTNGSFQAMVTAMRTVWGEERTREWLLAIKANNPVSYDRNTTIVTAVAAGEVEVGFTNHYYLYSFLQQQGEGFKARNYFLPGGGPGSLVMVSGAGVLRTSANQANGQRFIDFLLSVPSQQYFAAQTYEYPVVEGVRPVVSLQPLAELDATAVDINLSDLDDLAGTARLLSDLGILP
jgi:iron(III) transport system substrate-binding protein